MNTERLAQVMNRILDNPKSWDQTQWHCGTTHCFAGHAQIMAGKLQTMGGCHADAQEWLELTSYDADWLFDPCRTLPELHRFVSDACRGIKYDDQGFDQDGFDRYGYNRKGFDRDGNKLPKITITEKTNEAQAN